jgi:hypothetical protein
VPFWARFKIRILIFSQHELLRGPTHEIPVPLVLGMRGDASELGSKDAGGGLGDMVTGALSKLGVLLTHSHSSHRFVTF